MGGNGFLHKPILIFDILDVFVRIKPLELKYFTVNVVRLPHTCDMSIQLLQLYSGGPVSDHRICIYYYYEYRQ